MADSFLGREEIAKIPEGMRSDPLGGAVSKGQSFLGAAFRDFGKNTGIVSLNKEIKTMTKKGYRIEMGADGNPVWRNDRGAEIQLKNLEAFNREFRKAD